MKRCVLCKKEFPDNTSLCPDDGQPLVNADAIKTDPLIGKTIMDKYHIVKLLGRGGMGAVYEGEHRMLDRRVAIKVMHADIVSDDTAVARFFREAKTSAKLEHPNAVTIHDFGTLDDGGAFIVMEFIEGKSLRQVLSRNGALSTEQALEWFTAICSAVEAAHRRGIIHRDIKPENIMLKESPEGITVKVVDFGLAKLNSGDGGNSVKLSKTGDIMGTPQYMAPELFDGESADGRADVYALGIMFYEMITGSTPFTGSMQHVISGHLLKDPKPVTQLNPALHSSFDEVIGLALKKSRDERISSPLEFANELKKLRFSNQPINIAVETTGEKKESVTATSNGNGAAAVSVVANTPTLKHSEKISSQQIDIEQPSLAQNTNLINQKSLAAEAHSSNFNTGVVKANTVTLPNNTQKISVDEVVTQPDAAPTVKMTMSLDPAAAAFNNQATTALSSNGIEAKSTSRKTPWLPLAAIAALVVIVPTSYYLFSGSKADPAAATPASSVTQPNSSPTPISSPTPVEPAPADKSATKSNKDRKTNNRSTTQTSSYASPEPPRPEPPRPDRAPRNERAERDENGKNMIQGGIDRGKALLGGFLGGDKKKKDKRKRED